MSDLDISEALIEIARTWETYKDTTTRRGFARPLDAERPASNSSDIDFYTAECRRCSECDEEIYPDNSLGILRHITTSHGYRMDGRQFDNRNREITHV